MQNIASIGLALDALVPISRFNRGEAGKIFDEVKDAGCKIVVKNNAPICVMMTPEKYKEYMDMIYDQHLLELALEREANDSGVYCSTDEVMAEFGITRKELDAMEDVEIE